RDYRSLQQGELTVDDLGLGIAALPGPHVEDRAVRGLGDLIRYRGTNRNRGLFGYSRRDRNRLSLGGAAPEDVEAENGHENPDLADEVLHVRLVSLGQRRATRGVVAIE